jgi:uncharacterized protein (DUF58 family)
MGNQRSSFWRRLWLKASDWLLPTERLRSTKEGLGYWVSWFGLALIGWYQQINLILLVCGIAAGPLVTSFFMSTAMLRKVKLKRRLPINIFAGDPLQIDYLLDNSARSSAVLALTLQDEWVPTEPIPNAVSFKPNAFFSRVAGGTKERARWSFQAPARGRYKAQCMTLLTRFPFGLMERSSLIYDEESIVVYPRVGRLTRRWQLVHRESSQTRRGQRHDRSAQQQEYHGLRDYRPDDSPRWIHWRTSARINQLMIKEFEQQNEQDLAILLDPWLPRHHASDEMRAYVEKAIEFVASLSVDLCRNARRRITLGWTGASPDMRQGQASVRLLHEVLESLAMMKPNHELSLHQLLDIMPAVTLREAIFVVVTTRPMQLAEEAAKSERLRNATGRGLSNRLILLDVSRGELDGLVEFDQRKSSLSEQITPDSLKLQQDSESLETASGASR